MLMNESKNSWSSHFKFVKEVYQPQEIQGDPKPDMPGDVSSLSLSSLESAIRSGTPSNPPAISLVDMVS